MTAATATRPEIGSPQALKAALEAWRQAIGGEHVLASESDCDRYGQTTLPSAPRPAGIVQPATTREVQDVVKIAAQFGIGLHPISRGKNWGYGDMCPGAEGQVVVDLRRMDRILEVNEELAYGVVEPGVSQGQMHEHLVAGGSRLMLDVTGAGPTASIVGNTLQRGFGHTPYGDHFEHCCNLEVVLPDGEIINTGFGRFPNSQAAHVFKWGLGPYIDGLFTQSNAGIVTRMTIHLMPRPPVIEAFAMRLDDAQLGDAVDILRELRLTDVVRSTVHIGNDLRVLSSRERFRETIAGAPCPLPDDLRATLRKEAGLGKWNMFGGLYGAKQLRHGTRAIIRKAFSRLGRVVFFNRSKLEWGRKLPSWLQKLPAGRRFQETLSSASHAFELLEGVPTSEHLRGVGWRSANRHNEQTIQREGLIWYSPVLPMTAAAANHVIDKVDKQAVRHGFDSLVTLSSVSPRAMCCVVSVHYAKANSAEKARAEELYRSMTDELAKSGYIPYRTAPGTKMLQSTPMVLTPRGLDLSGAARP